MPVPVSVTVSGAVVAGLEIDRVPVRGPVWVGVKVTWTVQLALAANVAGQAPFAMA
jgi:hypothetical protein